MRALIIASIQTASGEFPTNEDFRAVFRSMGLQPRDIPIKTPNQSGDEFEATLKLYFQGRAEKILARIPDHNDDQREKKRFEKDSVIYSSSLVQSDTEFMVTRRNDGAIRFRLLNSRIGKLHEGAEEIIKRIGEFNTGAIVRPRKVETEELKSSDPRFVLDDEIEIYEHGLEEPTITGRIIYSRLRYILNKESREVLVAFASVVVFLILLVFSQYIQQSNTTLHGFIDRLETAMITTFIVSSLSLAHSYFRLVPLIQWSLTYEQK